MKDKSMKISLFSLALFIFGFLSNSRTYAQETVYKINTSVNPPYVNTIGKSEAAASGIALEIALGALNYKNLKFNYPEDIVPWKRSQIDTQLEENSVLVPLTRTKDRENLYQWITPIFEDTVVVYGLNSRKNAQNIEDLKKDKKNSIGVFAGGGAYYTMKDLGFNDIILYPVKTEEQNLQMLITKRHNYWVVQELKANTIIHGNLNPEKEHVIKLFSVQTIVLWAVTGKKTSKKNFQLLHSAFHDFKITTDYKNIIKKYSSVTQK